MSEKDDSIMSEAFHKEFAGADGESIAIPQFGSPRLPPQSQRLSPPGAAFASIDQTSLALVAEDAELGYRVDVLEADEGNGPEVWACATADASLAGAAVSVALGPEDGSTFCRVTVTLVALADGTCAGKRSFGSVGTVRASLGKQLTIQNVFLLSRAEPQDVR